MVTLAREGLPASLGWLTPGGEEATTRLGVELAVGGLRFTEPGPRSLNLRLPRTSPLVVEIGWSDPAAASHREVRVVAPGTDVVLGPMAGPVTLRTLAGQRYVIEPAESPLGPSPSSGAAFPDDAGEASPSGASPSGAFPAGAPTSEALPRVTAFPAVAEVSVPPGLNNLPERSGRVFVDRAGPLDGLRAALTDRPDAAMTVIINGMGGVGKTELALHYAETHQEDYSLIWLVAAENAAEVQTGLAALAVRLSREIAASGTTLEAADWAVGWLNAHGGWLLILDNADTPGDIEPLLRRLTGGHVLVTTRVASGWSSPARQIRLEGLDAAAAAELITALTGRPDEPEGKAAAQLAAELGYLPLALQMAAAYIRDRDISVPEYLSRLRARLPVVSEAPTGSVGQVLDVAIEAMTARDPSAVRLLRVLCCYAPDDIPRVILGGGGDPTGPGVAGDLDVLASYSMIALTPETVSVHRLIQSYIRDSERLRSEYPSDDPPATALEWLDAAIPEDPAADLASWPLMRALLPQADSVAALVQAGKPAKLSRVQAALAVFEDAQGQYEHALALRESALATIEANYGPDHPATAAALEGLGVAYQRLARYNEALPLLERALTITQATLGPDHPQTALRLDNLATLYFVLGRSGEALPLEERALAITEAAVGPDHPDTAVRLANLAAILRDRGRPTEALPLMERALAITEAAFGPDHPSTARQLENLAVLYSALGRSDQALPMEQRALAITEATLGPDHPDTAWRLANLAVLLRSLGRPVEALPLQQRALAIAEAAVVPGDPQLARLLDDLARTYRDLGRADEARPLEQRAAQITAPGRPR